MSSDHKLEYRPEINGLRAISILAVMFSHANFNYFEGGYLGVDVFFVISGYLITSIIFSELVENTFTFRKFYIKRIRRLLPPLYLMLLVCTIISYLMFLPSQFVEYSKSLIGVVTFTSNIVFWLNESNYFADLASNNPLLHTWSLSVEEQFYLIFPLILFFIWRVKKPGVLLIFIGLAIASLLLSEWGWRNFPTANYYMLPTRSWELLSGSITAILFRKLVVSNYLNQALGKQIFNALSIIGLIILLLCFYFFDSSSNVPSTIVLIPILSVVCIILFTFEKSLVYNILTFKPIVMIGLISYSAYLWHQPVFTFGALFFNGHPSAYVYVGLIFISLIFSYFSYLFVENPFRNQSHLSNKQALNVLGLVTVLFLAIGSLGIYFKGGVQRLDATSISLLNEIEIASEARKPFVRYGECHWYRALMTVSIEEFYDSWDCLDGTDNAFMLVGDSHAADKAVAFRQIGWDVGQLTGAGCSIRESHMSNDCKYLFSNFISDTEKLQHIDVLLLANRFNEYELSEQALDEIYKFWSRAGKEIIIFSSMPEFPHFKEQVLDRITISDKMKVLRSEFTVDSFRESQSVRLLESLLRRLDFKMIDSKEVFCDLTPGETCSPIIGNDFLMIDDSHLSPFGAKLFGEKVIELLKLELVLRNIDVD